MAQKGKYEYYREFQSRGLSHEKSAQLWPHVATVKAYSGWKAVAIGLFTVVIGVPVFLAFGSVFVGLGTGAANRPDPRSILNNSTHEDKLNPDLIEQADQIHPLIAQHLKSR